MNGYTLGDAEERAKKNPTLFRIPSRQRRWTVAVGHCAKLMFEVPAGKTSNGFGGERLWVEVTSQAEDGTYTGRVRNKPMVITSVAFDDEVRFEPRHVIDVAGPPVAQ